MKMNKKEWKKFSNLKDNEIDCSDIPELTQDFWDNAIIVKPKRKSLTVLLTILFTLWFIMWGFFGI